MRFTLNVRGTACEVRPDYHDGARGMGPVAWIRPVGAEPTGCALTVAGNTGGAREHSLSWFVGDEPELTGHAIDGQPTSREAFDAALLDACNDTLCRKAMATDA